MDAGEKMAKPTAENQTRSEDKSRASIKRPPLFTVLMHNDDYTTMEFVVEVLEMFFYMVILMWMETLLLWIPLGTEFIIIHFYQWWNVGG